MNRDLLRRYALAYALQALGTLLTMIGVFLLVYALTLYGMGHR